MIDDYSVLPPPPGGVPFDFAECEDFLARLEAEDSINSAYASSHSLSPEVFLSSGHGSSPLSSFSPLNDDPNDPNSWGQDTFLFPFDSNTTNMQLQQDANLSPVVKNEYSPDAQFYVDESQYPATSNEYSSSFGTASTSHPGSISSQSPSSVSPASSASSHAFTPPLKSFVPSPGMYTEPNMIRYQQPQQIVPPANPPATAMASAKSSVAASKRSPQSAPHGAVRKTSAASRGNQQQYNDQPVEHGAKGGKVTKPKKTAHNMIEKRYRTNLNDKISALRDCVPALRCAVMGSFEEDEDELDGLAPASKLNKATVLTKATEYILHLQRRNLQLQRENKALLEGKSPQSALASSGSPGSDVGRGVMDTGSANGNGVMGHAVNMMNGNGRNMMGKLMMGSMAGMMVANSFNDVDGQNTRGLAAVPFMVRSTVQSALGSNAHVVFGALRGLLLLGTVMYIFYPSLFESSSKGLRKKQNSLSFSAQPLSVSMPLEVRQQAWLTAVQTVDVPPRSTPFEVLAILKKVCKLIIRRIVGFDGYKLLIGTTEEQDFARTAAWKTALDAQLGGGDANCSQVRLLITLLASFLISPTPFRAMMQALHVKVLLHRVSWLQGVSTRLQVALWEEARELQRQQQEQGSSVDALDKTPSHLVHLLACDDVFDKDTVNRAYNLTWNNHPSKNCEAYRDEGLDSMLEDSAIKSPLDALAAWHSCRKLRGVLLESLDGIPDAAALTTSVKVAPPNSIVQRRALIARAVLLGDICPEYTREMMEAVREDLKLAVPTKNQGSPVANKKPVRTQEVLYEDLSTSAVESDDDDVVDGALSDAVGVEEPEADSDEFSSEDGSSATSDDNVTKNTASVVAPMDVVSMLSSPDTRIAIRCALVQTLLPSRPYVAEKLYSSLKVYESSDIGLLGFAAVLTTVRKMERRRPVEKVTEVLVGRTRIWIGGDEGEAAGIATDTRRAVVKECVNIGLRLGGYMDTKAEEDEGYASAE